MKNSQLDRLLRFAQRTGDRLIITDSEGKQPVVILTLDEYEALLDGRSSAPRSRPEQAEVNHQPSPRQSSGQATVNREPMSEVEEEQVDMAEIEAAVEATNREYSEEPKVVPVRAVEEEATPVKVQSEVRRPVVRRPQPAEPTEEQFYMEPV